MKRALPIIFIGILLLGCGPAKNIVTADKAPIIATIDLVNVNNDRVLVSIDPALFTEDAISFYIPKTVPGTYSQDNYGQYIDDLKALDYNGQMLAVIRKDEDSWFIENGKKLDRITYYVNDTFDTESEVDDPVFSPAGTNILKDENYLLNLHGFIGYFKGYNEVPYELRILAPDALQPVTSLKEKVGNTLPNEARIFLADRYFEVIDNPILFAKPNTSSFKINDINVTLSVYSPNNVYSAKDLSAKMETMMQAQKAFLGDIDGTKQYTILLYLSELTNTDAKGFGALEHHTSTVVVLPEQLPKESLEESMVDVVSHEFFHIVTPLNVHSREIQYFDFNEPKMSQHLWMYEGTTEYFANLFQVQQGLIDETAFYDRIMDKIGNSGSYDDTMSFTDMSKNILTSPYKENYNNVYEKGTLINMSLDILLRELSGGEKSVLWLMKELSKKYDRNTPFNDSELFDEIVAMTYPQVGSFFENHVIGNVPINYEDILGKVGLTIVSEERQGDYFFIGQMPYIDAQPADLNTIFIRKGIELNSFFSSLGAKGGDIITNINGTSITLENMRTIIGRSFGWDPEMDIAMTVLRDGKEITLSGKAGIPTYNDRSILESEFVNVTTLKLREAWLKN
jgi:predicted metalloprotease with PDZ domain